MSRNKKFLMVGAVAVGGYLVQKYGFPKDAVVTSFNTVMDLSKTIPFDLKANAFNSVKNKEVRLGMETELKILDSEIISGVKKMDHNVIANIKKIRDNVWKPKNNQKEISLKN